MKFKNSFAIPDYSSGIPNIKQHLEKKKAAELGEKIADVFGFNENPRLKAVFDIEIFACPVDDFSLFLKKITSELPDEYGMKVLNWVADLDKAQKKSNDIQSL